MNLRANEFGRALPGLVSGIAHHQAPGGGGEGEHRPVQRIARSRVRRNVAWLHAFHISQRLGEAERFFVHVTAALLHYAVNGFRSFRAGTKGVFIRIDLDSVRGHGTAEHGKLRHCRLVVERQRGSGSQHGRDASKVAPRKSSLQKIFFRFLSNQV